MSPMCSMYIINPDRSWYEPWRFLMYGFVHNSFKHLIGNVICQLVFGLFLELSHGSTRVGIIYLSGILLGGVGREITNEGQRPLAGASGTRANYIIASSPVKIDYSSAITNQIDKVALFHDHFISIENSEIVVFFF